MVVSKHLAEKLNEQINAEFWSAYLYLSMANHFEDCSLSGIANWFRVQFHEEQGHALRISQYLYDRGNKVILKPIDKVQTEWGSVLEAFEDGLAHEKVVTGMINELMSIARTEDDYATELMLQWFVEEQVEEEDSAQEMIDHIKLIGDDGFGLYKLDKELAERKL